MRTALIALFTMVSSMIVLSANTGEVYANSYDFDSTNYEYTFSESTSEDVAALSLGVMGIIGCVGLVLYLFMSYSIMVIANKLQVANSWLAFIPIGNLYILVLCAGLEAKYTWIFLAALIPFIGGLIVLVFQVYLMMKVAERRGFQNWLGILTIVPVCNIVLPAYLAFTEPKVENKK